MPQIEVMLELPVKIAQGLASGQLKRVGGVIVDAASKQVVAWLREGGRIASGSKSCQRSDKGAFGRTDWWCCKRIDWCSGCNGNGTFALPHYAAARPARNADFHFNRHRCTQSRNLFAYLCCLVKATRRP